MERKVRVRFAPSPTGALHIGGVRTALYNYLFARQHGGDMLLRIEDTDSTRFVPGAEEYIIEALRWLGIEIDEGIGVTPEGPCGPYRQSERREIYHQYVHQLLDNGKAYIAFDTPEELEAKRKEIPNFQYDASTRMQMHNSLTMSQEEVSARIAGGEQYVVRFKVEPNEDVHVHDLIRGEVVINSSILDDKVLYKSADDLPTYHMANIVDDHLMQISHVIRGEEWLPSAPLHVLLYRAFGWEDTMPEFAHLPLLLKPDGNGKLSKRDGDRLREEERDADRGAGLRAERAGDEVVGAAAAHLAVRRQRREREPGEERHRVADRDEQQRPAEPEVAERPAEAQVHHHADDREDARREDALEGAEPVAGGSFRVGAHGRCLSMKSTIRSGGSSECG